MSSLNTKKTLNLLIPRVTLLVVLDTLVINLSAFLALFIRHEFEFSAMVANGLWHSVMLFAVPNTLVTLLLFLLLRLYNSLWGFAGADELLHIFVAALLSAIVQCLFIFSGAVALPRSFPVLYGMLLCVCTVVVRFS